MARPHVDFIQSQTLPWVQSPWPPLAGCQTKLLGRDPGTGAATLLLRLPPDWRAAQGGWLTAGVEVLVVDGCADLNGRRYVADCYAWLPAGYPLRSLTTETGATVLAMFEAAPQWMLDAPPGESPPGAVEFVDAFETAWSTDGMDEAYAQMGLRWKVLRGRPDGTHATVLMSCPPHVHPPGWSAPQEVHDWSQELFLLSGDWLTPRGTMQAGAYIYRPPGIAHGPYGTRGGNLALLRSAGAPLRHRRTLHHVQLARQPSYQPVLPDALHTYLRQPWRGSTY